MKKRNNSGLDIDLGNSCSQIAYGWAKKTFANRKSGSGNPLPSAAGGFSTVIDIGGVHIGISSDGIGTKIELAERTEIYNTLGFDLLAMVADDLAANGIETVNISNILDVDHLDTNIVDHLMEGLHKAADFARITITGGEIAELGNRIGGYGKGMHFNWGATGIGILPNGKEIIDGRSVKVDDLVIALKSRGFRSNGFSLLRRIMENKFGSEWHKADYKSGKTWGEILLTPSLIYTPLIAQLVNNDFDLHGIVHVTGGGLGDNLARALKTNKLGANLDDIFPPHPFMNEIQESGAVAEEQAYRLWNMANGMLLIIDKDQSAELLQSIESAGYEARVCGKITNKPDIIIKTKGCQPQRLSYYV